MSQQQLLLPRCQIDICWICHQWKERCIHVKIVFTLKHLGLIMRVECQWMPSARCPKIGPNCLPLFSRTWNIHRCRSIWVLIQLKLKIMTRLPIRMPQIHQDSLFSNSTVTTPLLMIRLWTHQSNISSREVKRHSRKEYIFAISCSKFMHNSANSNHPIDLGNILDWNITRMIVNKVLHKWSKPVSGSCIPYQRCVLKIHL